METEKPIVIDLLDTPGVPALSSTSDVPVVETKPDAQNEGAPPAAAPKEEPEQPAESATAATEEPEEGSEQSGEPAKKESRGVQKALDRLASEREEQRRRAEAAEEREKALLEALKKGEQPQKEEPKEEAEQAPKRPDRNDYPDDAAYQAALDTYVDDRAAYVARTTLAKERAEAEKKAQQEAIEARAKAAQEQYNARTAKAQEKYADYKQVAENPNVVVSTGLAIAIVNHEQGPELQYYLGSNPDEAKRIFALPIHMQLMELGVIAASKLPGTQAAAPATPKPPISSAPAPIKPNRATTDTPQKDPEDMSMEEYAAFRKKQASQGATRH